MRCQLKHAIKDKCATLKETIARGYRPRYRGAAARPVAEGSTPTQEVDWDTPLHSAAVQEKCVDHTLMTITGKHDADATTLAQDPEGATPLNPAVLEESVCIK